MICSFRCCYYQPLYRCYPQPGCCCAGGTSPSKCCILQPSSTICTVQPSHVSTIVQSPSVACQVKPSPITCAVKTRLRVTATTCGQPRCCCRSSGSPSCAAQYCGKPSCYACNQPAIRCYLQSCSLRQYKKVSVS